MAETVLFNQGQPEQPQAPAEQPIGLREIGSAGLQATGGFVREEFLRELVGPRGQVVFREMSENDPIVGAFVFALNQMISKLDWKWGAPDGANAEEQAAAEFVQECFEDMDQAWDDVLEEILSMVVYGWSLLETVYKVRMGPDQDDRALRSRFDDGRIGWRKFAPRGQGTLQRWVFDENTEVQGMVQMDPYVAALNGALPAVIAGTPRPDPLALGTPMNRSGGEVYIPLAKSALFRLTQNRNNPEGRSLLRHAYRPWLFKTRIEEYEAIGIERDLVGYPVVTTPEAWHDTNARPDQKLALQAALNLVKGMRRGQSEGAVIPAVYDDRGNQQFKVELIASGGSRQIDIDKVLTRKNAEMAMSVLADFLTLGHEENGSRALGTVKVDLWSLSLQAVAKSIAEVMNRHVVSKLLWLNGMTPARLPKLEFGQIASVDLGALGSFLKVLSDAGMLTPDDDLEEWARNLIHAPAKVSPVDAADDAAMEHLFADPARRAPAQSVLGAGTQQPGTVPQPAASARQPASPVPVAAPPVPVVPPTA